MSLIKRHSVNDETVGNCHGREGEVPASLCVCHSSIWFKSANSSLNFMDKPIPREVNQLHSFVDFIC